MHYSSSLANLPKLMGNFEATSFRNEAKICQTASCTITQPKFLYYCYTMHVLRNTDFANRNPNVEQIPIMYNFYNSDVDYIGKMLNEFGLINMHARRNANEGGNGRCGVYPDFIGNPVVGRFLSPDIIVQNPNNTQCYNRYSYCINNPLKYSDPSGWSYDNSWTHNHNVPTFNHNFLEQLWGHNWSFNEKQEWNALLEATGGNSLNNAGELLDLLDQQAGQFKWGIGNMQPKSIVFTAANVASVREKYLAFIAEKNYEGAAAAIIDGFGFNNMLGYNVTGRYYFTRSTDVKKLDPVQFLSGQNKNKTDSYNESTGMLNTEVVLGIASMTPENFGNVVYSLYHEMVHVIQYQMLGLWGKDRSYNEFMAYNSTFELYDYNNNCMVLNMSKSFFDAAKNKFKEHYNVLMENSFYDNSRKTFFTKRYNNINLIPYYTH